MEDNKVYAMTVSQVIERARDMGLDDYLESLKSQECYHVNGVTRLYTDYWEDRLGWKFWEVIFNYIETCNIVIRDN